jgi:GNAT superfamily N-acetyltransferase
MTDIRRATTADTHACAAVLAEAFHDDPGTVIFEPDRERRARLLPVFFRNVVAAALAEEAAIEVAGEPIVGAAIWFGPDQHAPSPEALGAHGFGDVATMAGEEAIGRMLEMVGELERQHDELTSGPHLRLEFFGVLPASQGTGYGTALIEHGHRRADELGLPCYLETFTLPNVRYYERRGYELVHQFQVADGVPVYALVRPSPSAQRS